MEPAQARVSDVLARTGAHRGPESHVDAEAPQRLEHVPAREGLEPREQTVAAHQHRDPGAERGHPCRGLDRDHAAADDHQLVRHLRDARRIARGPRRELLQRRRDHGHRPGREDDGALGAQPLRAAPVGPDDLDLARAHEPAVPAHHVQPRPLGPGDLAFVGVVGDPVIAPGEQGGGVDLGRGDPRQVRGGVRDGEGAQQCLRGHAGVVGALAAQQLALDDRCGEVGALGRVLADVLADGPAAENDHVEGGRVLSSHDPTLRPGPGPVTRAQRRVRPPIPSSTSRTAAPGSGASITARTSATPATPVRDSAGASAGVTSPIATIGSIVARTSAG